MTEIGKFRNVIRGLGLFVIALVIGYGGINGIGRDRRLAENVHTHATIERTWVERGKGGGRFATLTFQNRQGDQLLTCHVERAMIPWTENDADVGTSIEVVPRPNTCSSPDIIGTGFSTLSLIHI